MYGNKVMYMNFTNGRLLALKASDMITTFSKNMVLIFVISFYN
jgi:hypothetical protein